MEWNFATAIYIGLGFGAVLGIFVAIAERKEEKEKAALEEKRHQENMEALRQNKFD